MSKRAAIVEFPIALEYWKDRGAAWVREQFDPRAIELGRSVIERETGVPAPNVTITAFFAPDSFEVRRDLELRFWHWDTSRDGMLVYRLETED